MLSNKDILFIALGIIGAGVVYFALKPPKKERPFQIPPPTNLYPDVDKIRAAAIDDDYRNFEKYISWKAANIHPSYQEYLKYWYGMF